MPLIDSFHDKVAKKISDNVDGYAQSVVNDVKVSYDGEAFSYAFAPFEGLPPAMLQDQIYQSMLFNVAMGQGQATSKVFSESRVHQIVSDLRAHNSNFVQKHEMADRLDDFYLESRAPGAHMLR